MVARVLLEAAAATSVFRFPVFCTGPEILSFYEWTHATLVGKPELFRVL